jgi:hypothetical protein
MLIQIGGRVFRRDTDYILKPLRYDEPPIRQYLKGLTFCSIDGESVTEEYFQKELKKAISKKA